MGIFSKITDELSTQENFSRDWYAYATNQIGHTAIGFVFASLVSYLTFLYLGEFAPKECIWLFSAMIYGAWETLNGKPSWDSLEDWIFFAIYGAGSATMLFSEVSAGSPMVVTQIVYVPKFTAIIAAHLSVGVVARIVKK